MTLPAMASRYYPGAIQRPGPAGKVYPNVNTVEGVIMHSMQGNYEPGATSVLYDESVSNTNAYRAACWHFSILRDGTVYQHYALDACPFHAGNGVDNRRLIGIEHEGGPPWNLSEPLTEAQIVAGIALVRWIAQQAEWPDLARHVRLLEHNETTATVCPSGRIPWGRYTMAEKPMTVEDVGKVYVAVVSGNTAPNVEITPIPAKRPGWAAWTVEVQR